MLIITGASVNGTSVSGARMGIGFTDGLGDPVRQFCIMNTSQKRVKTSATGQTISNTSCIGLMTVGGDIEATAIFSQWVTDGLEIWWTSPLTSAYLVTAILFGGNELSA